MHADPASVAAPAAAKHDASGPPSVTTLRAATGVAKAGEIAVAALRGAGIFEQQARVARFAVAPVAVMAFFHLAAARHPPAPSDVPLAALAPILAVPPHWLHLRTPTDTPVVDDAVLLFHSDGNLAIRCPADSNGWVDVYSRHHGDHTVYSSPPVGRAPLTKAKKRHKDGDDDDDATKVFAFCDAHAMTMSPVGDESPMDPEVLTITPVPRPDSRVLPADGPFLALRLKDDIGKYPLLLFPDGAARVTENGDGWLAIAADHA